jgi:hypothetical protein
MILMVSTLIVCCLLYCKPAWLNQDERALPDQDATIELVGPPLPVAKNCPTTPSVKADSGADGGVEQVMQDVQDQLNRGQDPPLSIIVSECDDNTKKIQRSICVGVATGATGGGLGGGEGTSVPSSAVGGGGGESAAVDGTAPAVPASLPQHLPGDRVMTRDAQDVLAILVAILALVLEQSTGLAGLAVTVVIVYVFAANRRPQSLAPASAPPRQQHPTMRVEFKHAGVKCEGTVTKNDWDLEVSRETSRLIEVKFRAKKVVIQGGSPQQRREAQFLAKAALFHQLRLADYFCIALTDASKLTITADGEQDFKGPTTIPCFSWFPWVFKQQLQRNAMFCADARITIEEPDENGKRRQWEFYRLVVNGVHSQAWVGSKPWASSREERIRQGKHRQGYGSQGNRTQLRPMGPFEYKARRKQRAQAIKAMGNRRAAVQVLLMLPIGCYALFYAIDTSSLGEIIAQASGLALGYIRLLVPFTFAIGIVAGVAVYFKAGRSLLKSTVACVTVAGATFAMFAGMAHVARGVPVLSDTCSDWNIPKTPKFTAAVQFCKFCAIKASEFGEYINWSERTIDPKSDGYGGYVLAYVLQVHSRIGWFALLLLFALYVLNKPSVSEWISIQDRNTFTRVSRLSRFLLVTTLSVFVASCVVELGWNIYSITKSHEMCQQMIKCYNLTIHTVDATLFECPDFNQRFKWMSEVAGEISKPKNAADTTTIAAIAAAILAVFQGPIGMLKNALVGKISKLIEADPLQSLWDLYFNEERKASDFDDTVTVQLNTWDRTVSKDGKLKVYTLATLPFSKLFDGKADGGTRVMNTLKNTAIQTVSQPAE